MDDITVKPWEDLRRELGESRDRAALLRFFCAVSGYDPLPHQIRAHLAGVSERGEITAKMLLGGIGAGKTYFAAAETVMLFIVAEIGRGASAAVVAPTFDQCIHSVAPAIRHFGDAMAANGYPIFRRWKHSTATFEGVSGGRLFVRSADRIDSLRGFSFSFVHIDESEAMRRPGYVFDTLLGRIRDTSAPFLQMHVTTTPRGMGGVVGKFLERRTFADGLPPDEASRVKRQWWVGRAPTAANHHLPPGYLQSLRAGYSKRQWEQEVEARILRPEGAVFPMFDRSIHLRPWRYDQAISAYTMAVDWGHSHPSVLFMQRTPDGAQVIFDEFCEDNVPRDHLRDFILQKVKRLGRPPTDIAADRAIKSENQWLRGALPSSRVHTMQTRKDQDIRTGLQIIEAALEPVDAPPRLYIADHLAKNAPPRGIVRCFEGYRWAKLASGATSDRPQKDNRTDHGIDALRYAAVAFLFETQAPYVVGRVHGAGSHSDDWIRRQSRRMNR